jgi:hypothetical protein
MKRLAPGIYRWGSTKLRFVQTNLELLISAVGVYAGALFVDAMPDPDEAVWRLTQSEWMGALTVPLGFTMISLALRYYHTGSLANPKHFRVKHYLFGTTELKERPGEARRRAGD